MITSRLSTVHHRVLVLLVALQIFTSLAQAAPPAWWAEYSVTNESPADDYAAINQGQLKNLALGAFKTFDNHLPGGAADALVAHISMFYDLATETSINSGSTDDFAAVNLGQLKVMAIPFYDQLIELNLYPDYPWSQDQTGVDNYAAANIGQAKNLFSFELPAAPVPLPELLTHSGSAWVGAALNLTVSFKNDPETVNALTLPPGLTFNTSTYTFESTPTLAGIYNVTLIAENEFGTSSGVIAIVVYATAPTAPTINSLLADTAIKDSSYAYRITASNRPAFFEAGGLPSGLTLDSTTGIIEGVPTSTGTFEITITAGNAGGTDSDTLVLDISAAPGPVPAITSADTGTITVGESFTYTVEAVGATAFAAEGLPEQLVLNPTTGVISGSIESIDDFASPLDIVVSASNANGGSSKKVRFEAVRSEPIIESPGTVTIPRGVPFYYQVQVGRDPESISISGLAALGLSYNPLDRMVSGTLPNEPETSSYSFTIEAGNSAGIDDLTVSIHITADLPQITGTDRLEAVQYTELTPFQIVAGPNIVSYSVDHLPAGLSLNTSTGVISGTPTETCVTMVRITVTNESGTAESYLRILVKDNEAPGLMLPAKIYVTQGTPYSYQVEASAGVVEYAATGLPTGLSINATTGMISGTPTTVETPKAVITATDQADKEVSAGVLFVVLADTVNVNATMTFQAGVSPTTSYETQSAGIGKDTPTVGFAARNIGDPTGTQVWRVLLGFDLSSLPMDAEITASSLHVTIDNFLYPSYVMSPNVELLSVDDEWNWEEISWSLVAGATTTHITSSAPTTSGTQTLGFATNSTFIGEVASAFDASDQELTLLLRVEDDETLLSEDRPLVLAFTDQRYNVPETRPSLTVAYDTAAPPEMNLPSEWVLHVGDPAALDIQAVHIVQTSPPSDLYDASNLPSGLSIDTETGIISGTPTTAGEWTAIISAENGNGTGSRTLPIRVLDDPEITSALTWTFMRGSQVDYTIEASGIPIYFSAANLPYGLQVDASTGRIFGNVANAGTTNVTIRAANEFAADERILVVTVTPKTPQISGSATVTGSKDASFSYTISASESPTSYGATGLPTGLSLMGAVISGTPTVMGSYTVDLTASNITGTGTKQIQIVIGPVPLPSVPDTVWEGSVGQYFYSIFYVNNGYTSLSLSAFPGPALPPGLTLSSGTVSGTPTTEGTYTFTIEASNAHGSASGSGTIIIHPEGPWIDGDKNFIGIVGEPLEFAVFPQYGTASITLDGLPEGFSWTLEDEYDLFAIVSGVSSVPGVYSFTATISDGVNTNVVPLSITIKGPPSITSALEAIGVAGQPFTYTLTAEDEITVLAVDQLPEGWTFNASTGEISGTPTAADIYVIPLTATNPYGQAEGELRVLVTPSPTDLVAEFQAGEMPNGEYTALMVGVHRDGEDEETILDIESGDGTYIVGRSSSSETHRLLLGYDIGSLPDDIEVTSASVTFQSPGNSVDGGPVRVSLYSTLLPISQTGQDWQSSSGNVGTRLSDSIVAESALDAEVYFNSTLAFANAVRAALSAGTSLDMIALANTAEDGANVARVGFLKDDLAPGNNPKLTITYQLLAPTEAPEIGQPLLVEAVVGQTFEYSIHATHRPNSYAASDLPSGLSLNSTTGLISGTPTMVGEYRVPLEATNSIGTGEAELVIRVHHSVEVDELEIVSGDAQISLPDEELANPLQVRVLDDGVPVPDALVIFELEAGQGWIPVPVGMDTEYRLRLAVVTDSLGMASAPWRMPTIPGVVVMQVSAGGAESIEATATAAVELPNPDDDIVMRLISGGGQSGASEVALPQAAVVQVSNIAGARMSGRTVEIETLDGSGTVSPSSGVTDAAGRVSFTLTPIGSAGAATTYLVTDSASGVMIIIRAYVYSSTEAGGGVGTPDPGGVSVQTPDPSASELSIGGLAVHVHMDEVEIEGDFGPYIDYQPNYAKADVSWSDVKGDPDSFILQRRLHGQAWQNIQYPAAGDRDYIDEDSLRANRRYEYRIVALRDGENSAPISTFYSIPLVDRRYIIDSYGRGFKGVFEQFTSAEIPKYYLTMVQDGKAVSTIIESGTGYNSSFKETGIYFGTQTHSPREPGMAQTPGSYYTDYGYQFTHATEHFQESSSYHGESHSPPAADTWYRSEGLYVYHRDANGDWKESYESNSSNNYLDPRNYSSRTEDSGTINSGLVHPNLSGYLFGGEPVSETFDTQTFNLAYEDGDYRREGISHIHYTDEYTTQQMIADTEGVLQNGTLWSEQYQPGFFARGDAIYTVYSSGGPLLGRWDAGVAHRDLAENEKEYTVNTFNYKIKFNPASGDKFEWVELFVPEEATDLDLHPDAYDTGGLVQIHAKRSYSVGHGGGEPTYFIDPRVRAEDGQYYIVPIEDILVRDNKPGAPDKLEMADGIPVGKKPTETSQFIVLQQDIPGSSYKVNWTSPDLFKVYLYDAGSPDGLGEEVSNGWEFTDKECPGNTRFIIVANEDTHDGSSFEVTVRTYLNGVELNTSQTKFILEDHRDYSMPVDEASGARYRKIALNGTPMPDSKPQQQPESDQEPEESFVDALTLGLRHSTTDFYLPIPGSDLALSARRDHAHEVWSERGGLRPQEEPDKPFGAAWTTNLAGNVKLMFSVDNPKPGSPIKAYVTDEGGATHAFFATLENYTGEKTVAEFVAQYLVTESGDPTALDQGKFKDILRALKFYPMPTAKHQQTPNLESLAVNADSSAVTFEFTRKYGTKVVYEMTNTAIMIPDDRLAGSITKQGVVYARIKTVTDRLGYQLNYNYVSLNNLVPSTIRVAGHPGIKLDIRQDAGGRITAIWDGNGNKTEYFYIDYTYSTKSGVGDLRQLSHVQKADGANTYYEYETVPEEDLEPLPPETPKAVHWHCEISKITDPLSNVYSFEYALDHSKLNYKDDRDGKYPGHKGYYVQCGLPRNITKIVLPLVPDVTFTNQSKVWIEFDENGAPHVKGARVNEVRDAGGLTRAYVFDSASVVDMPEVRNLYPENKTFRNPKIVVYEGMTIRHGSIGSERFEFTMDAGMALKKVIDFSGNTTSYEYDNIWTAPNGFRNLFGVELYGHYSDPTSQTNALGGTKHYTYTPERRLMSDIVDEEGRDTHYTFDSRGRRVREEVSGDGDVQVTTSVYGSSAHPGFVTRKSVEKQAADLSQSYSLVIDYQPDENGRVKTETVAPGSLNLKTTYTYDAVGNRTSITDARGNTSWMKYDKRNRLVLVTSPDGSSKHVTYDLRGNKTSETDENGHVTTYDYDALNRVTYKTVEMPDGDLVTHYTYTALGSIETLTDPRGAVTSSDYDALNRLETTTDAKNHVTHFYYNGGNAGGSAFESSGFKPTSTVSPRGVTTTVTYDALYRPIVTKIDGPDMVPHRTAIAYDAVGNPTRTTDALNRQTNTTYDWLNRPKIVTYPDQTTEQTWYTSTGHPWKVKDRRGHYTETKFDQAGRVLLVTQTAVDNGAGTTPVMEQPKTSSFYDGVGNVVTTIDAEGNRHDFAYDSRNRKVKEWGPSVFDQDSGTNKRPCVSTVYDAVGNVVSITNARGFTTTTVYDNANRPTDTYMPEVAVSGGGNAQPHTHTKYDKNGNATEVTDANGHTTKNVYDSLNRLTQTTDAAGNTVYNQYDAVGNLVAVFDGKRNRTRFGYDGLNRNIYVQDHEGREVRSIYNAVNKIQRIDSLGQVTSYIYDVMNRLDTITYADGGAANPDRKYTYDAAGNLLTVVEAGKGGKADVTYTYDDLNRLASEASSGVTHTYRYDLVGNRRWVTYGGTSRVVESQYDALNRLTVMNEGDGARITQYRYDLNGNVRGKLLPNEEVIEQEYDALNRMVSQTGVDGSLAQLYSYEYEYDLKGNLKKSMEDYPTGGVSDRTVANGYDSVDRLVSESITVVGGVGSQLTTYEFDEANNRTKMVRTGGSAPGTTTYVYNHLNQLTSYTGPGGTHTLTYDLNGNRTARIFPGEDNAEYGYDFENRLIRVYDIRAGDREFLYTYDYRTRRVGTEEIDGPTTLSRKIIFSGGLSVRELEDGNTTVEYIRGSDWGGGVGGILYSLRDTGTGVAPSFNHYNNRGDVTTKTNVGSDVTYQAAYEAFGTRTEEEGTTPDRQKANTKDEDPTGLLNEGFRYRDLETGTFLTRDPLGFVDGPNLYAYVLQNPWTKFDPEGLWGWDTTGYFIQELGTQSWNLGGRVLGGIKETGLVVSDSIGFGAASAFGYGDHYEGNSQTFKSIAASPESFDEDQLRADAAIGGLRGMAALGTAGGTELIASGYQASQGNWEGAQDSSVAAVFSAAAVRGANPNATTGQLMPRASTPKVGAEFFNKTRIEVEALKQQGLSTREAFAQIRKFNSGNPGGYLFHFTNSKGGQGIVRSGELHATRHGMDGPGVYAGTTPTPNFFQRYFSPIGWGLNPGSNARIPIRVTPQIEAATRTPKIPRWTRVIGEGENIPLSSP